MTLDVDVTKVFPDSESINQSLPEAEFRPPLDFETRNFDTNKLATSSERNRKHNQTSQRKTSARIKLLLLSKV